MRREFDNGKKFNGGEKFANPSGRDFCNGHYMTPSSKGTRVSVRENGVHQRDRGSLKAKFEIVFDLNYFRKISKQKRITLFVSAHELANRAEKK